MKKVIFTAAFVLLFFINLDKSYSQELIGEDERIVITVDSVERTDSFPERLKQQDFPGQKTIYIPPSQGYDFVFIHITEDAKVDLRMKMPETSIANTHLIDDKGETYLLGQGNFRLPRNIAYPLKISGYFIFEIPKDATPVQLNYLYQYREETPDDQEIKIGQINVML